MIDCQEVQGSILERVLVGGVSTRSIEQWIKVACETYLAMVLQDCWLGCQSSDCPLQGSQPGILAVCPHETTLQVG